MSEGTVEELQEKVHQLEESLRKVKSVDDLPDFTTGIHIMTVSGADLKMNRTENMLLFVLMSRNSNLLMTDSVLSKVTDFLAI